MNIFNRVKSLNLPLDQYVVFGSGPMSAHEIRKSNDIDLFVTEKLFHQLAQQGEWRIKYRDNGQVYLVKDIFEVDKRWKIGDYSPDIKYLIENAKIIKGVPFAPLTEVMNYKRVLARPKDLDDIKLIREYLEQN